MILSCDRTRKYPKKAAQGEALICLVKGVLPLCTPSRGRSFQSKPRYQGKNVPIFALPNPNFRYSSGDAAGVSKGVLQSAANQILT